MATEIAELGIEIDPKRSESGIRRIEDRLNRMATRAEQSVGRASTAFDRLKKSLFSVRTLIGSLGAGLILRDSINTVIGFEKSISNLSAITGATGRDLEFLRDAAREMGAATTLSASQAAEAFKLIASAKPDLLENVEALRQVTQSAVTLAEAAGISLPDAARALGGALNQFGAGAEQANRFINVMAEGARLGASEITETAEAMRLAGTVAASMGISFEETNSIIQQLAKIAIKGSDAGTGLRNVLLRLESSTNKNLKPSVVGLTKALQNLRAMNLSVDELNKMFGLRAVVVAQQLVAEADSVAELAEQLEGTNTAFVQAQTNFDNLEGDLKRLGSALEELKIEIFGDTDALRGFVQSISKLTFVIKDNIGLIGSALKALLAFSAARFLGPLIASIGTSFLIAGRNALLFATRLTAAQQRASILRASLVGLRGLLAFLGGPGGLVLLGATALFSFGDSADAAQRSVKDLNTRLLELQGNQQALQLNAATEELKELTDQYKELSTELEEAAIRMNRLQAAGDVSQASVAQSRFQKLAEEARLLVSVIDELKKKIEDLQKPKSAPGAAVPGAPDEAGGGGALDPKEELRLSEERDRLILETRRMFLTDLEKLELDYRNRRMELENITAEGTMAQAMAANEAMLLLEEEFLKQREELELRHQARLGHLEAQGILQRRKFEELNLRQKSKFIIGELTSLTSGIARYNKTAFEINKAASIANAIISTYEGMNKAWELGPIIGPPMAALVAAAGFANVNAIKSQSFGGGAVPSLVTSAAPPVTQVPNQPLAPQNVQAQQQTQVSVNLGDDDELISKAAVRNLIRRINEEIGDGVEIRV